MAVWSIDLTFSTQRKQERCTTHFKNRTFLEVAVDRLVFGICHRIMHYFFFFNYLGLKYYYTIVIICLRVRSVSFKQTAGCSKTLWGFLKYLAWVVTMTTVSVKASCSFLNNNDKEAKNFLAMFAVKIWLFLHNYNGYCENLTLFQLEIWHYGLWHRKLRSLVKLVLCPMKIFNTYSAVLKLRKFEKRAWQIWLVSVRLKLVRTWETYFITVLGLLVGFYLVEVFLALLGRG